MNLLLWLTFRKWSVPIVPLLSSSWRSWTSKGPFLLCCHLTVAQMYTFVGSLVWFQFIVIFFILFSSLSYPYNISAEIQRLNKVFCINQFLFTSEPDIILPLSLFLETGHSRSGLWKRIPQIMYAYLVQINCCFWCNDKLGKKQQPHNVHSSWVDTSPLYLIPTSHSKPCAHSLAQNMSPPFFFSFVFCLASDCSVWALQTST